MATKTFFISESVSREDFYIETCEHYRTHQYSLGNSSLIGLNPSEG